MRYAKFNRVNGSVLRLLRQLSYLQSVYFRGAIMLDFPPLLLLMKTNCITVSPRKGNED